MKFISLVLLFSLSSQVLADGDHEAPATIDGAAKLLEDGDFTLTPAAEKRMSLQWQTLSGKSTWIVPAEAIVKIKFTKAVYRKFEGKITMVVLDPIKAQGNQVIISSADLESGDQVAIKGVKFLRLAELDISSGTVDSCAH